MRDPVKRQITMTDAMPSTPDDRPKPSSATDPATRPAMKPTPPSTPIHAKLIHDSLRAQAARRRHSALPTVMGICGSGPEGIGWATRSELIGEPAPDQVP